MLKKFIALAILTGNGIYGIAQTAHTTDTISPAATAVTFYYRFIDHQSRLYNGNEHRGYSQRINGFAYFRENDWQQGTVFYDGLLFKDVPLLYDLNKDQVIVQHFNEYIKIALINDKVKEFTIGGHHFVRMVRDSINNPVLKTGFYDVLYKGNLELLAYRTKYIEETITDHLEQDFIEKNFYYIKKDGKYKIVKSYKGLREILKEKSREIRRYLKKNKIRYRKDKETAIITAVKFYDSPNN